MPLTTYLLEDFAGWAIGVRPGTINGTGWLDAGLNNPIVAANANFHSGKCLQVGSGGADGSADLSLTGIGAGLQVFQANVIRTVNSDSDPIDNRGTGLYLLNGTAVSVRMSWGQNSLGLGNTFYLVLDNAGARSVLYQSPNIYLPNVKMGVAWTYDSASRTFSLWLPNAAGTMTQVFSAGVAALPLSNFTTLRWGEFGAVQQAGITLWGDLAGYSDNAYLGYREVRTGVPTANGPAQDWTVTGAVPAWDAIDNLYTNAPAEHIEAAVLNDRSEFACPVDATNLSSIDALVHRYFAERTDVTPIDMAGETGESVGWAFAAGATQAPPQNTYQFMEDRYGQTNPRTAGAWTIADLVNMATAYERLS